MRRGLRWLLAVAGLAAFVVAGSWAPEHVRYVRLGAATSQDPRLAAMVQAIPGWREALRSNREVVDVVCLVPDEATFFDAIAAWDARHWFPILIDEPELVLGFLRAFRPSRIVRWPAMHGPIERKSASLTAVARSWSDRAVPPIQGPDAVIPNGLRGPGIVLASPEGEAVCGGVALAAGRRQSLGFWAFDHGPGETLDLAGAMKACAEVAGILEQLAGPQVGLGDRGDFVSLAGDWPDRYRIPEGNRAGEAALDDLLGRDPRTLERLAFTGRLLGPPARAVYQAMAAMFVRPGSVLLFNTYPERTRPWDEYLMSDAADRLGETLPTTLVQGRSADRDGWHKVFDPINPFGLVLINSSGGLDNFRLRGGRGETADVPRSVPAALIVIHSFSAARPEDEATLAGRWLADGAFAYFGAMNEPYLHSFRTPTLVAELLANGVPLAAATYKLTTEDETGAPWRLRLVGDPLYRLKTETDTRPRIDRYGPLDSLEEIHGGAAGDDRLRRCVDAAYLDAAAGGVGRGWREALLAIERIGIEPADRAIYDALLAELVTRDEAVDLARAIPESDRSPVLRRAIEARDARP